MTAPSIVILGCGYTGSRVAAQLVACGIPTLATTRHPARLRHLEAQGLRVLRLDASVVEDLANLRTAVPERPIVLHSVPLIKDANRRLSDPTPALLDALDGRPARVVYLSTTSVYGAQFDVDEATLPAPRTRREMLRVAAEQTVLAGAWETLVLRPAAIYGPGRGVHVSLLEGRYPLAGDGANFVSRIHVDDLAAQTLAALFSSLTGVFPVADDEPCTSREMVNFCVTLLGLPMPPAVDVSAVSETRRANRRVNGHAVRSLLGVSLRYPSYRTGVLASLNVERAIG